VIPLKIIRSISKMQKFSATCHQKAKTIGCVMTMGYLHEGHLSLVRGSLGQTDITVATLFVNPTQFGPNEDLERYPRDEERDIQLLQNEGVDAVFIPTMNEIYPLGFSTYVGPPEAAELWCGASRPVHFRGVCTVVSILLNIIQPTRAFFGQKDAQQCAVIKSVVRDLRFPTEVVVLPTVREKDGLAMSSRNKYLSTKDRKDALVLSQTLMQAKLLFDQGESDASKLVQQGIEQISTVKNIKLDYLAIVDQNAFIAVEKIDKGNFYIGAIYVGKTRLIDNICF
jgi:pantoate--beta-alanine ligase